MMKYILALLSWLFVGLVAGAGCYSGYRSAEKISRYWEKKAAPASEQTVDARFEQAKECAI
jgi:hypothetical protein